MTDEIGPLYRYFVTRPGEEEREVTEAEYVAAERLAGFVNTLNQPGKPSTSSFFGAGFKGRLEYIGPRP